MARSGWPDWSFYLGFLPYVQCWVAGKQSYFMPSDNRESKWWQKSNFTKYEDCKYYTQYTLHITYTHTDTDWTNRRLSRKQVVSFTPFRWWMPAMRLAIWENPERLFQLSLVDRLTQQTHISRTILHYFRLPVTNAKSHSNCANWDDSWNRRRLGIDR